MSSPDVSVIIPTYNRADVLPRAIESVLDQSYNDLELIIVDDGSTDNTTEVVQNYTDDCIEYVKFDDNFGANAARTEGMKLASGNYISFLDSDDEWLSTKVQKQVSRLQSTSAEVVYTGIKQVGPSGNHISTNLPKISGNVTDSLLRGNFIGSYSALMISKTLVNKAHYPNPDLPCWQDWEWYLRLSDYSSFEFVNQALVIRHNEGDQISSNFQYKLESSKILIDALKKRATTESQYRTSIAYLNFHVGYSALSNKRYATARSLFIRSIKICPTVLKFYIYLIVSNSTYPIVRKFKRILVRLAHMVK